MKKIYVDCLSSMLRVALVNNSVLEEIIIDDKADRPRVGDIYAGKIEKILPSGIAFVNVGFKQPVFLQLSDFREKNTAVKCGDDVVVQVLREEVDDKKATVTTEISAAGRYAVVTAGSMGVGVSRKIEDSEKRSMLKQLGEKYKSEGIGLILRTSCADADPRLIEEELAALKEKCVSLKERARYAKAPSVVEKGSSIAEMAVRDLLSPGDEVIINDKEEFEKIAHNLYDCKVSLYEGKIPMFSNFFLEGQIEKALHGKVWLKCGGWLDIDCTEAMTVIDVNSGKYNGSISKVNMEAAEECARQIRLRNLNGMIIIDFINESREENEKLRARLEELVKRDRVKTCIVGMTGLGLMELTRQKTRKPLYKLVTHKCPVCGGTGLVENRLYTADKILNTVINIFTSTIYKRVVISADKMLLEVIRKGDSCRLIESRFGGKIELKEIAAEKYDYYNIEKFV